MLYNSLCNVVMMIIDHLRLNIIFSERITEIHSHMLYSFIVFYHPFFLILSLTFDFIYFVCYNFDMFKHFTK